MNVYNVARISLNANDLNEDPRANDLQRHLTKMAEKGFTLFQVVPSEPLFVITQKWEAETFNVAVPVYKVSRRGDHSGYISTMGQDDDVELSVEEMMQLESDITDLLAVYLNRGKEDG